MQLDLFSMPKTKPQMNNLFFAIFPTREAALQLAKAGTWLDQRHQLRANPRPIDHLHISLLGFGQFIEVPSVYVETAKRAGEAVAADFLPFQVTLNQALIYNGNGALVLESDEPSTASLKALCGQLWKELNAVSGSNPKTLAYTPHVTLAYSREKLKHEPITPIGWAVSEIELIISEDGKGIYHRIGKWQLGAGA